MKTVIIVIPIAFTFIFAFGAEFPICDAIADQQTSDVVFDGTEYTVVYDSAGSIWGAKVNIDGSVRVRFRVSFSLYDKYTLLSIVFDGQRFCVVCNARSAVWPGRWDIAAIIIEGTTPVNNFTALTYTDPAYRPSVAYNGDYYLITARRYYYSDSALYGAFYYPDGTPAFDNFVIEPATAGHIGAVTTVSDGDKYLVAYYLDGYEEYNGYDYFYEARYRIITPPGTVSPSHELKRIALGQPAPVSLFGRHAPALAFDGTRYFCAYGFYEEAMPDDENLNIWAAFISPVGEILQNDIGVAVTADENEAAPDIIMEDRNFSVVYQTWHYRNETWSWDICSRRFDQYGNPVFFVIILEDHIVITDLLVMGDVNDQTLPTVAFDGIDNLAVWQDNRQGTWDIWGDLVPKAGFWTDDPLALAYNGNRHLTGNTGNNCLFYTDHGKVIYRENFIQYDLWTLPFVVGSGSMPALAIGSNGLPSVVWLDGARLMYRRMTLSMPVTWSEPYCLYDPWAYWQPRLNAPPAIVITSHPDQDSVHVLVTLHAVANGPVNWIAEYAFSISQPLDGSFAYIEGGVGPDAGPIRSYPSLTKSDADLSLHLVWQRADTICYATRQIGQAWNNWGPQFGVQRFQSVHPFVETYGDSIFVVWQHQAAPTTPEEVWRARRYFTWDYFLWDNLSRTVETKSLYPVNTSGTFTIFVDQISPSPDHNYDIFYKIRPIDPLTNISESPDVTSLYPQATVKFLYNMTYCYTTWLEGNSAPYEIRFQNLQFPDMDIPAYLTSANGYETPSPYLVARDSFITEWQIPVDVGFETISYRFPLAPGYRYRLKAVVYHQSSGEWQEWIKIDDHLKHLVKYDAYEAETLELWIPPAFYKDGTITVTFERKQGDFAVAGPIYIYRYEYKYKSGNQSGGPMAQQSYPIKSGSIVIFPNPFKTQLNIRYTSGKRLHAINDRLKIKIYDTTGRLVIKLNPFTNSPTSTITWCGTDESGRAVAPGVYFITIENTNNNETNCHKIIKIE